MHLFYPSWESDPIFNAKRRGLLLIIFKPTASYGTKPQSVYFFFQSEAVRASAIYGTFVTLPLFLIWLQISWLIVLLGAEISFAYQNIEKYEFEREALNISPYNRRMLTFLVMHAIVHKFKQGGEPLTPPRISHELGIPIRLVREIIKAYEREGA